MKKENSIKLFEENKVRSQWNEEQEKWYFSIIDIVAVLTEQKDYKKAQSYWTTLKHRLKNEGSEVVTKCDKLKLIANDGKKYQTDVADIETIFRLIQSIPSPKAEPFKLWIAKVARERIDEIEDPEIGIDRLMETYLKKGYNKEWINRFQIVPTKKKQILSPSRGGQRGRKDLKPRKNYTETTNFLVNIKNGKKRNKINRIH